MAPVGHVGEVLHSMDTSNRFVVVCKDEKVFIGNILVGKPLMLPASEALNLAAWIRLVADPEGKNFDRIVNEAKTKV